MAAATAASVHLAVYGLHLRVSGDWPEAIDELRLDFAWFEAAGEAGRADVEIVIERREPDFDSFGEVPAAFVTPRNVVYQHDGRTIVDYFGRAVSIFDRSSRRLVVQGVDKHLVHEAAYHFALSSIGQHLDAQGLPRLHALALAGASGAVAVMLPSGGGKSTLALRALEQDGVRLLAEDTPLLDRRGRLHPFPLRIGINATDADRVPEDHVRRIERMEFHPKLLLDPAVYANRVERTPQPLRHLLIGRRSLGRSATLEPAGRSAALGPLLREVVFGVGVYQGMEFVLERGMREVAGHSGVLATRVACCAAGLARTKVWRLTLGRDHQRNWEVVAPLLA